MKKTLFLFASMLAIFSSRSQSKMIIDVFRLLPADKIFDLSLATRDSMLAGKTYYPADNDSTSIEAYNYGISIHVEDYMFVSMSFETSQRATAMVEIRSFKTKTGENLIIVSQTGGVEGINYQQNNLDAFIYKNKKLVPYNKNLFPVTDESNFLKPGAPDSVKQVVRNNSNLTYDLSHKLVRLGLDSQYLYDQPGIEKWLKENDIEFKWTGDRFIIKKIR